MQGILLFLPVLLVILAAGSADGEAVSEVETVLQRPQLQEKAEVSLDRETRDAAKKNKKLKNKNNIGRKQSGKKSKTGRGKGKKKQNQIRKKGKKQKNKNNNKGVGNRKKKKKSQARKNNKKNKLNRKKKKGNPDKKVRRGRGKNGSGKKKKVQKRKKLDSKKRKKAKKDKNNRKKNAEKRKNAKNKLKRKNNQKKKGDKKKIKSKKERRRLQAERRKGKKLKNVQPGGRQGGDWSSCGTTGVNDTCLLNAVEALNFEKTQIQNFFKQKARLTNHDKTTGNKLKKNDNFNTSAEHMLKAIGGDIDNPTCGENTTVRQGSSKESATKNYKTLLNCSVTIKEACTMPETIIDSTKLDTCATIFTKSKTASEDCRTNEKYTTDGPAACACWELAAIGVALAKKEGCSSIGSTTAKKVKAQKKKCIDAFSQCKKTEDAAIQLIHACMSGEVNSTTSRFLNF